ncbi:MAG: hypothetical protein ACKVSF_03730 [Alphaproteobacteria bacterium]
MIRFAIRLTLATLAWVTPAVAADIVIVASNVPAHKAGQIIDSAAMLDLAAGQKLTFIAGNGKSVTRAGPYKGPVWDTAPPAADKKFMDALASLAAGQAKGGQTLGAVRGAHKGEPVDPWVVDIGRGGDQCVASGAALQLWRASADKPAVLHLAGAKDEGRAQTDWPAGAAMLPWPAEVKLADGAVYMARLDGAPSARRLVLHLAPDGLLSDAHRAVWMAEMGCALQARILLWGAAGASN